MRMSNLGLGFASLAIVVASAVPASAEDFTREQGVEFAGCASPRAAVMTVLYWTQPAQQDEPKSGSYAAACFDEGWLGRSEIPGPEMAGRILTVFDQLRFMVAPEEIPDTAKLKDDAKVYKLTYEAENLKLRIIKQGERWVWSAGALGRLAQLYSEKVFVNFETMMPEWAKEPFLGLKVWQWLGIPLLILLGLFIRIIVGYLLTRWVTRLTKRLDKMRWLNELVEQGNRNIGLFVLSLILSTGLPLLQLPLGMATVLGIAVRILGAVAVIGFTFKAIDIFAAGWSRRADGTESKLDDQLVPLVRKALKVVAGVIGGTVVLQTLSVDVGSLLAGLGIGGLAFALAAKDTLANLFGSVMVFIDKPFQIGDFITLGSHKGTVEEVGVRTSRLRTSDGVLITIPNARMTDTPVENWSQRPYRRYRTVLGLTYDTPPDSVHAFVEGVIQVIEANPLTIKEACTVRFTGFGASALEIIMVCKFDTRSYDAEQDARHKLNTEILRLATALGVEFAFPSQSLYVAQVEPGTQSRPTDPMAVATAFGRGGQQSQPERWEVKGVTDDSKAGSAKGA